MGIAHLAFDFRLGHQCRHRVHHNDVHRIGAHQHVGNFQRLLAGVRLGDVEVIHIDPELAGIFRIQRVLGINKSTGGTLLLCLGDY